MLLWQTYSFYTNYKSVNKNLIVNFSDTKKPQIKNFKGLEQDFFGTYIPIELQNNEIKQSLLNLEIVGIIFSELENESEVIIKLENGKNKIFKTGQFLHSGIQINQIMPENIIVKRNGILESLSFPKQDLEFIENPNNVFKE